MGTIINIPEEDVLALLYGLQALTYVFSSYILAIAGHKAVARCYAVIAILHLLIAAWHIGHGA